MADQGGGDEQGATGRRWGIAWVGIAASVVLVALGIALNRSYLAYLGVAVFVIFGLTAAGVRTGWFSIPGIGGGGGSFPDETRSIESPYVVDEEPKQQSPEQF